VAVETVVAGSAPRGTWRITVPMWGSTSRLRSVSAKSPRFSGKYFKSTSGAELEARELAKSKPGLIIDPLIGYGLRAAPQGPLADAIQWANASGAPILALDVPSGVDADDGDTPGMFIRASWTMTLALPKTGLLPERTGTLFLADIGIPQGTYRRIGLNFASPFGISGWVGLMPKPNHRA